jgi:hypothetical protein
VGCRFGLSDSRNSMVDPKGNKEIDYLTDMTIVARKGYVMIAPLQRWQGRVS